MKNLSSEQKSYLAGFLDGDGSIYVRLKPNTTYRFGYQMIAYVAFFQSSKHREEFEKVCKLMPYGLMRIRKDGILEYTISKQEEITEFLLSIKNYLVMKKPQAELVLEVMKLKQAVKDKKDFKFLMDRIETFRELNYSKKRKIRIMNP